MSTFGKQRRCTQRFEGSQCQRVAGHTGSCRNANGSFRLNEPVTITIPPVRVTEPLYSWRWWRIGPRGYLQSMTAKSVWYGPTMTTCKLPESDGLCRVSAHNPITGLAPAPGTDWGVYSYKRPDWLFQYNKSLKTLDTLVLGRIENSGHVIEHEYGYRSQVVVMRELWIFAAPEPTLIEHKHEYWRSLMSERYECDVHIVSRDKLDSWLTYYGQTLASNPGVES